MTNQTVEVSHNKLWMDNRRSLVTRIKGKEKEKCKNQFNNEIILSIINHKKIRMFK